MIILNAFTVCDDFFFVSFKLKYVHFQKNFKSL